MARGERREVFGSSRRKLVHVAATTAATAAGISPKRAPASTSQRQMNHAAREAALDHHPPAVMPAGTLPGDPLMSSRYPATQLARRLPGEAGTTSSAPGRTALLFGGV